MTFKNNVAMANLWTAWILLGIAVHVTEGTRKQRGWETTPFPPPSDQGLFHVVQNLVQQVADITSKHARDWIRLRRIERRGKSTRHDVDVMHADIVQLRQHVTEINTRLDNLDDLTTDLHLKITKVSSDQLKLREDLGKLRHTQHSTNDRLEKVETNITTSGDKVTSSQAKLHLLQASTRQVQESQRRVIYKLKKLEIRMSNMLPESRNPFHPRSNPRTAFEEDFLNDGALHSGSRKSKSLATREVKPAESTLHEDLSGDGETAAGYGPGSGEAEEFFLVGEKYNEEGSGEEVEADKASSVLHSKEHLTPTPLTTNPVPTLTQASLTPPTSPTHPCASLEDLNFLRERVQLVENRVELAVSAQQVLHIVSNETERLDTTLVKHEMELAHVQGSVAVMGTTVSRLARQMASLRLTEFMDRLQSSLVNFTANVLTLEQWQLASQQIMNTTQDTHRRITELASRVMENGQMTSDLQMRLRNSQAMSERQYRLLQTYVIRLNNSLQDLQERVTGWGLEKPHPKLRPGNIHAPNSDASENGQQEAPLLTSRVDDLALQLVYSDNRLSHLETQLLNASLQACQKSSNDAYQDASLHRLDQDMAGAQQNIAILKEKVKRLDLGLYRLHGDSKASQEVMRKVKGEVKGIAKATDTLQLLRKEVDNLLFQLPVDCEDYYRRGHHHPGEYVIYPRDAPHSLKVNCVMYTSDSAGLESNDNNNNLTTDRSTTTSSSSSSRSSSSSSSSISSSSSRSSSSSSGKDRLDEGAMEKDVFEDGGWTVVQQRNSGKVNFTRSWAEYAVGFGSPDSEYWLGNDHLHLLTRHRNYTLLLSMTDIFGGRWSATYRPFAVSSKEDNYRLTLGRFGGGNASDSLTYSADMTFSTYDRDNDASSSACARYNGGGWWYSHCQISNLNGPYDLGMIWFQRQWRDWLQLRQVQMLIKPMT